MRCILRADLSDVRITRFLNDHLADLAPTAPAESRHALNLDALRSPRVRVWALLDGPEVIGTVALAALDGLHEEVKSMRTHPQRRGEGVASTLLEHAIADARQRRITRLSLETGSMKFFAAA